MTGRQLPVFSLMIPFWLVAVMSGWRAMLEVWPACLAAGLGFAATQFAVSNFHGPWLVDSASAVVSVGALLLLLRFWRPRAVWRFPGEAAGVAGRTAEHGSSRRHRRAILRAWSPWLILAAVVLVWALPVTRAALDAIWAPKFAIRGLDGAVLKAPPLVRELQPESAVFILNPLSATGTAPLVSALLAGVMLGLGPLRLARIYFLTFWRLRFSLLTIGAMLALAFTSRYAGLDSTLGLAFANTGALFPFFSPVLGWLGVALTGSDTASNVLFGNLQQVTAHQLGLSPILAAAANSTGGVMGKMLDAQSIVVAGVATGQSGQEGRILRAVFWHSLALVTLVGVLVLLEAYCFPGVVPR
jgi:lactate permease